MFTIRWILLEEQIILAAKEVIWRSDLNTKIYSVFPACGKTWLCKHQDIYGMKILDSDSSHFSWVITEVEDPEQVIIDNGEMRPVIHRTKTRNPDFPANYIQYIKENIGKYNYIFVSSHASVREALDEEGIDFTIVYPSSDCLAEWIGRCFIRDKKGEEGCGPEALYNNWLQWWEECVETGCTHKEIVLYHGEHLSDYMRLP